MADGGEKAQDQKYSAELLQLHDELVDMLMLLDYETGFCKDNKELKPMSRTYFTCKAENAALQFKYFSQLVAWCLQRLNLQADWDEYDDPNTVITNMLRMLPENGIQANVQPAKLKQGNGDHVCQLLHTLTKEVLRRTNFEYSAPAFPDEGMADEAEVDSDAEIHSVGEDEMQLDGEEDDLMYQEDEVKKPDADADDDHAVLESNIDPKEWLLEIERVAPRLKIQMPNDSKEWRTHLQQTRSYKQVIETQFPAAKAQLEKLQSQVSQALDRIKSKEAFINEKFDHRALDYRQQQEEFTQVKTNYTELSNVVMNLQIELKNVVDELDVVRNDLEERSSTVQDTAPLVKMKDAFKKLRADTRQLEVRIGVVSHTLMQAKLRQRPQDDDRKHGLYGGGRDNGDGYDDDGM
jgi:estrogen-related receptor beta like 1